MPIDLTKLSQSELLQVVNATPLGVVLTRPRLRRQMDAGALRFGDGQHIHLVRYVRWLIEQLNKPKPAKVDYIEARRRQAEKNRAATKASQDIWPLPEIEDWPRRCECGQSFRRFCEVYFPVAFHRAWSDDHLRVIGKIERAVREGGLFAFAMPRGSGKTSMARDAALWAVLYGYRPFVCLIAGSQDNARELLSPIKKHILENPLLLADFAEAIHPLRCLENSSKRQLQQHCRGQLTHVHWGQDKLVFPTIEGRQPATGIAGSGAGIVPVLRFDHHHDQPGLAPAWPAAFPRGWFDHPPVTGLAGRPADAGIGPVAGPDPQAAGTAARRRNGHGRPGRDDLGIVYLHGDL